MKPIYLDNAATSRPKPEMVYQAMDYYMREIGCSPGRGGYECALQAGRIVLETRLALCRLFHIPSPEQIIFTSNITHSLNFALKGLLNPGDHVITTSMEHNSVVRPLRSLEKKKVAVDFVPCDKQGFLNPHDIEKAIRENTKMIVLTHASNVVGTLLPVAEIGKIARQYGLFFVLDTAQTAGIYEIDFEKLNIDVLAFTGHKGLFGPPGIGGFAISKKSGKEMKTFLEGGTGSISDFEFQPDFLPDKFEAGTMNTVGIIGLKAGVEFILSEGLEKIRTRETQLCKQFINGLQQLKGLTLHGPQDAELQTSTISISVKGYDLGELSYTLDAEYGIMTRSGLHCAPLAHKTLGTFPEGTLRFSLGYFNTEEDIDATLKALEEIVRTV
jgi:cysteine desulfurase family protein